MKPFFSTRIEKVQAEYQKWDYITLSDFQEKSWGNILSYAWLWFLAVIAVAGLGADTFTAVNLLVFDRWSSQIDPTIPFRISKWIFAACIIVSWLLCIYEWIRAIRVIRRRNVAESYLDPLAVRLQSIRFDKNGRGWRRFLVFAEMTKSKAGADYVALFAYFQFKGAIRILLAEGPRQVINGMTLYGVMQAKLMPVELSDGRSALLQFFVNVQILANEHTEQAVILFSMLFTFVIWAISALSFLIACALYGGFLWHYIPSADRTLSRYCRRKIDKRLGKIVNSKFKVAMRKQDAMRRCEQGTHRDDSDLQILQKPMRRPTLPALPDKSPILMIQNKNRHEPDQSMEPMPPPYSYRPTRLDRSVVPNSDMVGNGNDIERYRGLNNYGTLSTKCSISTFDSDDNLLSQAATMGTSAVFQDQINTSAHELHTEDYNAYDLHCMEQGLAQRLMDPPSVNSDARGISQQYSVSLRRPLQRHGTVGTDVGSNPLGATFRNTTLQDMMTEYREAPSKSSPGNIVRFGSITQIPPKRNFSLPSRNPTQFPKPTISDLSVGRGVTNFRPQESEEFEMQTPHAPAPTYHTYYPSDPPPINTAQEQQYHVKPTYQIRTTQIGHKPRRNMTLPLAESKRFAPPRRVATEPLPQRGINHERNDSAYLGDSSCGNRRPIPAIRNMVARAPERYEHGTRNMTRKVYRYD